MRKKTYAMRYSAGTVVTSSDLFNKATCPLIEAVIHCFSFGQYPYTYPYYNERTTVYQDMCNYVLPRTGVDTSFPLGIQRVDDGCYARCRRCATGKHKRLAHECNRLLFEQRVTCP
ncbi:hypothetical protein EXD76_03935 [BEV proteobacterium]|nr:hypothetical protein [Candidatus Symbiopectobacterium sp. Chty_BC]